MDAGVPERPFSPHIIRQVPTSTEDHERLVRLYDEILDRLAEIRIMARNLELDPEGLNVHFTPEWARARMLGQHVLPTAGEQQFRHIEYVCGEYSCGWYDYDVGVCGECGD
jgi:hypothetical protein